MDVGAAKHAATQALLKFSAEFRQAELESVVQKAPLDQLISRFTRGVHAAVEEALSRLVKDEKRKGEGRGHR